MHAHACAHPTPQHHRPRRMRLGHQGKHTAINCGGRVGPDPNPLLLTLPGSLAAWSTPTASPLDLSQTTGHMPMLVQAGTHPAAAGARGGQTWRELQYAAALLPQGQGRGVKPRPPRHDNASTLTLAYQLLRMGHGWTSTVMARWRTIFGVADIGQRTDGRSIAVLGSARAGLCVTPCHGPTLRCLGFQSDTRHKLVFGIMPVTTFDCPLQYMHRKKDAQVYEGRFMLLRECAYVAVYIRFFNA